VIERHKTDFVGVIDIQKNFSLFLQPIKMYTDILFQKIKWRGRARRCGISSYRRLAFRADSPFGVKVLGKPGEHDTEIHAILARRFTS
jgi:ribonuclease R